jgi:hypothetical protein
VQLVDDHGRVMDAEYLIEVDGGYLALLMESRSVFCVRPKGLNQGGRVKESS